MNATVNADLLNRLQKGLSGSYARRKTYGLLIFKKNKSIRV